MDIDKPHDKFFKETFSRPDILTDFLHGYLPSEIFQAIDLSTLVRETDSFMDEELSEHFADLIFTVSCSGKPLTITLLLEHKSYYEEHPHFQVNQYLLNVWAHQLKDKKPLTAILPIVVYHGKRRWKKRPLSAYLEPMDSFMLPFVPTFDYVLIDLSTTPEDVLPRLHNDYARLTALLLQNSRRKKLLAERMEQYAQVMRNLAETVLGQQFIGTAFIYLSVTTGFEKTELLAIFRRISTITDNSAMTAYQQILQEGIEQGIEQGIVQGIERGIERGKQQGVQQAMIRTVRGALKIGMDAQTIADTFDMPLPEVILIIDQIQAKTA